MKETGRMTEQRRRGEPRVRRALAMVCAIAAAMVGLGAADATAQSPSGAARIGYLEGAAPPERAAAFRRGLTDLGYVENRTIVIEWRSAAGQIERLPAMAAELVRLQPQVIVASGPPAALAAKSATATIPIVMVNIPDPVGLGLVASHARPGGNITGLSSLSAGLLGKRLELLAEIVPGLSRVGVVWEPANESTRAIYRELQAVAVALRLAVEPFEVTRPEDLDAAVKAGGARAGGVAVLSSPIVNQHREVVVAAAARHKVPAIYFGTEFAEAGGLVSYGANIPDLHRRAAAYVDRILKGAKPGDLPVEQPTTFELAVNFKAAKALGLVIPQSIHVRADVVIE
jgi:putative tryptophan/tyrosine transport system substrate-binding protein